MKKIYTVCRLLLLLLVIYAVTLNKLKAQVDVNDSLALVDLYNSTDGLNWKHSDNWLTTASVSEWFGIKTAENRVDEIQLFDNNLNGTLPASIGNLTSLQSLQLRSCNLKGTIPPEIGKLTELYGLSLDGNQLTGNIPPEIGNNTKLDLLVLNDNQLSGSIPSELGNTNLSYLELSNNQLSGSIPSSLGNCANFNTLSLHDNQLTGSIPSSLGNLTQLVSLYLNNNQLSGSIPPKLGDLKKIHYFILANNQLSGNIPPKLGNLRFDQNDRGIFDLSNNQLSGNIPPELSKLRELSVFNLSHNQLSGNIPTEIGNLKLNYIGDGILDLSYNQLNGAIPTELGNSDKVRYLNLSHNQISGRIPRSLAKLKVLRELYLSDNQLSGSIPPALAKLYIYTLDLSNNKLRGAIPKFGSVETLNLSYNKLTSFPKDFWDYPKLVYINVSHNNLKGRIPKEFNKLTRMLEFDLEDNKLKGALPLFLSNLPLLEKLNVRHNHFTFDGMEALSQHNFEVFKYDNERQINLHQTSNTLSVYAGGTLSNNTYKWYKDGALISTINGDSTFTPTESGNYSVAVTNSIATELTLYSDTITFSTLRRVQQTDISSVQSNNKNIFSVYPNPAKNVVTISFAADGNYTLKLADMNGNILQTKAGVAVKNKNILQLNIGNYAVGEYFVTLSNEKNETQTLKLQKQ